MLTIGLTGSIGMGKSTTAGIFRNLGVPVYDSDKAVHQLYEAEAVAEVGELFPSALSDGKVDRSELANLVLADPDALRRLEAVIHPRVLAKRMRFLDAQIAEGAGIVVLDIPLLFETGADRDVDVILVVSAPTAVQKARVLARPGMTLKKFDAIVARQVADEQKRRRAHIVINTALGMNAARDQIQAFLRAFYGRR